MTVLSVAFSSSWFWIRLTGLLGLCLNPAQRWSMGNHRLLGVLWVMALDASWFRLKGSAGENGSSFGPSILPYCWLCTILKGFSNWVQPLFRRRWHQGRRGIFQGWMLLFANKIIRRSPRLGRSRYKSSIFHWLRILWNSWQVLGLVHLWLLDWWSWLQHQFWLALSVRGFL